MTHVHFFAQLAAATKICSPSCQNAAATKCTKNVALSETDDDVILLLEFYH